MNHHQDVVLEQWIGPGAVGGNGRHRRKGVGHTGDEEREEYPHSERDRQSPGRVAGDAGLTL